VLDLKYCTGSRRCSKLVKRQKLCWIQKRIKSTPDMHIKVMIMVERLLYLVYNK
jgi:hypothetical protein